MREEISEEFNAEKFVDNLLTEGEKFFCDETSTSFNSKEQLPHYFDERLFKLGQSFFHKHIFAMFFSKLLGVLTLLADPDGIKILILTGKSSSNLSAYKRYMSTIFHMGIWYDDDFKPGSRLWKSVSIVKKRHNSASNKGYKAGLNRINQKSMACTQFGFMGYALVRSELVGIHNATDEEFHAFISMWRVIGYVLGIEDRFNICRESVQETKDICNLLIDKLFKPALQQKTEDFVSMTSYIINGLWVMAPFLDYDATMAYLHYVIENNKKSQLNDVNLNQKIKFKLMSLIFGFLKYDLVRLYHNLIQRIRIWLMRNFPILAYYYYGKDNSLVKVL